MSTLKVEVEEREYLNSDFQLLLRVAITQSLQCNSRLPLKRVADELEKQIGGQSKKRWSIPLCLQ